MDLNKRQSFIGYYIFRSLYSLDIFLLYFKNINFDKRQVTIDSFIFSIMKQAYSALHLQPFQKKIITRNQLLQGSYLTATCLLLVFFPRTAQVRILLCARPYTPHNRKRNSNMEVSLSQLPKLTGTADNALRSPQEIQPPVPRLAPASFMASLSTTPLRMERQDRLLADSEHYQ